MEANKENKMNELAQHIANGGGICGTCAEPATATAENEGYSYCCNDRIEYGDEASETVAQANCKHEHEKVETTTAFGLRQADGTFPKTRVSDVVCADCGLYLRDAS